MKPLQKEDFELLKEMYEEIHGYSLIELVSRETLLGGYYSGASALFNFLENCLRFGDDLPVSMEEFEEALRVPSRNNCYDNAQEILTKTRIALKEPIDQLPKLATTIETSIWKVGNSFNEREFDILAAYQKNKVSVCVPDYAIVARWRLAIGV